MELYEKIDRLPWPKDQFYDHYMKQVPCTYTVSVQMDMTQLRQALLQHHYKLYPALIHMTASLVNHHNEFRYSLQDDQLIRYKVMHPSYTVFHEDDESFSNLWTSYHPDFALFHQLYLQDQRYYGSVHGFEGKPGTPENSFCLSCLPWLSFTSLELNIQNSHSYLTPIFTYGKYYEQSGRLWLPLSIQAHHAVCDGFHVSRLINELQELFNAFPLGLDQ